MDRRVPQAIATAAGGVPATVTPAELLELLYEAAQDPSHWDLFLAGIARTLDLTRCAMVVHWAESRATRAEGWVRIHPGDPPDDPDAIAAELLRILPGVPAGHSMDCAACLGLWPGHGSMPASDPPSTLWVVENQPGLFAVLAVVARGPGMKGYRHRLAGLLPHIRRALVLEQQIWTHRRRSGALASLLGRSGLRVALMDAEGNLTWVNARAARLLDGRDGVGIVGSRLCFADLETQSRFHRILSQPAGGVLRVRGVRGAPGFRLAVHRIASGDDPRRDTWGLVFLDPPNASPGWHRQGLH